MDPHLYYAAIEGKVDVLQQYSVERLVGQLTANNNTMLHVAAQFGHVQFVKALLRKCPDNSLFSRVNSKGETALHFAAREGYAGIVNALIEHAKGDVERGSIDVVAVKEMLLRVINNEDGDTALHMAVRNSHVEVVRLLTAEDPELTHKANKAQETPLYLAAEGRPESRHSEVVFVILDNCARMGIVPAYSGPGGRTALHAAALFDRQGRIIKRLLDWKEDVIKETDEHGWTPLHCAARAQNEEGVKRLLEREKSVAYITANRDEGKTALHIAASLVYARWAMSLILQYCPDCWEVVNSKGQNVLHIAIQTENLDTIDFISRQPWSRQLINQKDNQGNTPLHLIAQFSPMERYIQVSKFLQNIEQFENWRVFNNQNMTPRDLRLFTEGKDCIDPGWELRSGRNIGGRNIVSTIDHPDNIAKWKIASKEHCAEYEKAKQAQAEMMKKVGDTHLIVATLITTVTFAANFTMPGGYNSNVDSAKRGTPLLLKEAAFKLFVLTNTIALMCSTSSVVLYMIVTLYGIKIDEDALEKQFKRYVSALILNLIAVAAMMIAFIAGSYSMLSHERKVASYVCVIVFFSFLIYFLEIKKVCTYFKRKLEETDLF